MSYVIKKIKKLLIPLYVWNMVYALFAQIMSLRGFSFGIGVTLRQLFIEPITTGHQYIYNLASWFVVPLFMVEVFYVLFRKALSFIKNNIKEYVCVAFAFALGMLGIWMASKGYNTGWWLVLTRFLYFIPFYCAGFFYKKILEKKDGLSNFWYFFIIIGIQLIIIIYKGGTLYYWQAWSQFTEFNAWPFVVGFLGIAFWLRVARVLEPVMGKSKIINLIADNTFSIMMNQFLGFMLVKAFFAIGYKYTNILFQDFAWSDYHTNIWYYYLPKGLQQTRVVYIFVAIALAIVIQKVIDRLKKRISYSSKNPEKRLLIIEIDLCIIACIIAYFIAAYVQNNGGVQIPKVNWYSLGSELFFDSTNLNASKYCISGFSTSEEFYTWTDGKEAILDFNIDNITSDLSLNLECGVYGESQDVNVYINEKYVDSFVAVGNGKYKIDIPYEVIEGNDVTVKFEIPEASSPASNGESTDDRVLGLSIEKMSIVEK